MKYGKIISLLLALCVLMSLTACGSKDSGDPNLLKVGNYEALYTGSQLYVDSDGDDAIGLNFTYTNKSDAANSFEWSFFYTVKQADKDMEFAVIFVSEDSFDTLSDASREDVEPGQSKDVVLTYKLKDKTSPIVIEASGLFDDAKDTLTIDPKTAAPAK